MPDPLVPALVAALAAAAGWAGFSLSERRARRRFEDAERTWRTYAASRGLTLVPFAEMSGVAGDIGPPLVKGEVQGVEVELLIHSSTRPVTSVEATLPGVSPEFVMLVRRRGRRAPRSFEGRRICEAPTGNKAFDAAFALLSNEPDLARSLLDRRLAQVVLGFPRAFEDLHACENRFVLRWRGVETDEAVLNAAVEVVFTACRRRA